MHWPAQRRVKICGHQMCRGVRSFVVNDLDLVVLGRAQGMRRWSGVVVVVGVRRVTIMARK